MHQSQLLNHGGIHAALWQDAFDPVPSLNVQASRAVNLSLVLERTSDDQSGKLAPLLAELEDKFLGRDDFALDGERKRIVTVSLFADKYAPMVQVIAKHGYTIAAQSQYS
jgi:hypothetical protein